MKTILKAALWLVCLTGCYMSARITNLESTNGLSVGGLSLVYPSAAYSKVTNPIVRVSGVISGDRVSLYADSSCTLLIQSQTATSTSVDFTLSLYKGTYEIFAAISRSGTTSACSSVKLDYQIDQNLAPGFPLGDGATPYPYYDIRSDGSGAYFVVNGSRLSKITSAGLVLWTTSVSTASTYFLDVDSENSTYVSAGSAVLKFDSNGNQTMTFGSAGSGNGQFSTAQGVAVDSSKNIYVADYGNNRVQKFDSSGNYLLQFGTAGSGAGQFSSPSFLRVSSSNQIYVFDSGNSRVQIFSTSGTYISEFGTAGSGDGQFNSGLGSGSITFKSNGDVLVSDDGNTRVQVFTSTGVFKSAFGTSGTAADQFMNVGGMAFSPSGTLYVTDPNVNGRLKSFDQNYSALSQVQFQSTTNLPGNPLGITIDPSNGDFIFADSGQQMVYRYSSSGVYKNSFSVSAAGCSGSLGGQVNLDSAGNIYLPFASGAGCNKIGKFTSAGSYVTSFSTFGVANGQVNSPNGVVVDSSGNIWVADTGNNRVQKLNSAGAYVTKFGTSGSGNGQFAIPRHIALDSAGNIYVADQNNYRVQKFDSAGTFLMKFGSNGSGNGQFQVPAAIYVDASGKIYVTDTTQKSVQVFDSAGTFLLKVSGFSTSSPQGVVADVLGNFFVSNTNGLNIKKYNSSGVLQGE